MIPKNTVIHVEDPFAYVLCINQRSNYCDYCLTRVQIKKCSACGFVGYCNKDCQTKGWLMHKYECKNLKGVKNILKDDMRLLTRIIYKMKKGDYSEKFSKLKSCIELFVKDDNRMLMFNALYVDMCTFIGVDNVPEYSHLLQLYCTVRQNSCSIIDIDLQFGIAIGFYLLPATLKHSCKPNTSFVHCGPKLILSNVEDIPELDWEKVTVSYINLMSDTKERQKAIMEMFYTECSCEKCKQPEFYVLCPNTNCKAGCNIEEETCQKCSTELTQKYKDYYKSVLQFTKDSVDFKNKNANNYKTVLLCKKKLKRVVHPTHPIYMRVLEQLCYMDEINKQYTRCLGYIKEYLPPYEFHYTKYNFGTGAIYYKLSFMHLLLNEHEEFSKSMYTLKEIFFALYGTEMGEKFVKNLSAEMMRLLKGYKKQVIKP